jgi:EAL domain-containing protein (putative c-di-GMP-specific phosphodiesterase class I)
MQGKNRFVLFDVTLKKYEEDSLTMEKALKKAVDADCVDFQVFYQPIIEAATDRIIGAEALVRWFSQEFGLVSPVKFIPIAESTGLIIPLGKYILREACKMAKKWMVKSPDFSISVNFSVIQMLQADLIQTVMGVLKEFRISAKQLIIEITESLAINDINKVIEILTALRGIGVKIAIDDFGTGYSSLNHLRRLPLDCVKIDRSFIFNIDYDPYTVAFVETITRFCHLKGAKICSEGVETETQKSLLKTVGVDLLQGYLFAKPAKASEFEKLLDHQLASKP